MSTAGCRPASIWGNGLAWLPGKIAFGNDTDGRWRRTFAHELGHNRNLGHWDATIRVHGFDVAAREVREDTRLDFMVPGRLENEAWVAPEVYTYLHEQMSTALGARSAQSRRGTVADEYLLASGLINQDGTGSFDVVLSPDADRPAGQPTGRHSVLPGAVRCRQHEAVQHVLRCLVRFRRQHNPDDDRALCADRALRTGHPEDRAETWRCGRRLAHGQQQRPDGLRFLVRRRRRSRRSTGRRTTRTLATPSATRCCTAPTTRAHGTPWQRISPPPPTAWTRPSCRAGRTCTCACWPATA